MFISVKSGFCLRSGRWEFRHILPSANEKVVELAKSCSFFFFFFPAFFIVFVAFLCLVGGYCAHLPSVRISVAFPSGLSLYYVTLSNIFSVTGKNNLKQNKIEK